MTDAESDPYSDVFDSIYGDFYEAKDLKFIPFWIDRLEDLAEDFGKLLDMIKLILNCAT